MSLTRGRELPIGARAGLLDPKHVKAIGSARWLYDWILWRVTSEQDGVGRVLGGSPVRCEEIAADLGVGLRTVYRWMRRLRGPYIRTRHVVTHGRHGLAIEVLKSKKFHISTSSTANPANAGRKNPASFGRENPAKTGRFHKEERKPLIESHGKRNLGFLENPLEEANRRTASPLLSPPVLKSQTQDPGQNPTPGSQRADRPPESGCGQDEWREEWRRIVGAKALGGARHTDRVALLDRQRRVLLGRAREDEREESERQSAAETESTGPWGVGARAPP